ncbi:hypothetical protein [Bowmanella dokdonensis]|nr:hypothetical protein [Bowmanella dokdonensis]
MKVTSEVRLLMKLLYYVTMALTVGMVFYLLWMAFTTVYNGLMA